MEYDLMHASYCRLTVFCGSTMEFRELCVINERFNTGWGPSRVRVQKRLISVSEFCMLWMSYGLWMLLWMFMVGIINYNRWILSWLLLMVMVGISNEFIVFSSWFVNQPTYPPVI